MNQLLKKRWVCVYLLGGLGFYTQAQNELTFVYDPSGNQIERKFTSSSKTLKFNEEIVTSNFEDEIFTEELSNSIRVYPNPTKGNLKLEWDSNFSNSIKKITVTDSGAQNSFNVPLQNEQHFVLVDLTPYSSGLYLIHFILDETQIIVKKIIKN